MQYLDRLRGYYVRAPRWVHSTGGLVLSALPPKLLYGRTFREVQADVERSEWDAAFVEQRVRSSLATLWEHARVTTYYRELVESAHVDKLTPETLDRLPILEKETVKRRARDMLSKPLAEMDEVSTGGTSSMIPLTFYLDKNRSVREWAFLTHVWQRCGYELGDRLAVLGYRGVTHVSKPSSVPWSWEPGTRELRLSPMRMVPPVMDEYLAQIRRFRINFIYGYPSAIAILAAHAADAGWSRPPAFKGILLMSESIRPFQRQLIRDGFGDVSVMAGYGLSEKVAIAGEIPGEPDVYEFEPLYGLVELVDETGAVINEPGKQGRLIGTGFVSLGMPMIRYDTGDLAVAVRHPAAENCWRLRVRNITSRHCQDYLVTREGGLIAHTVLYPHNTFVRECQFIQEQPGVALLRVVLAPGADPAQLATLQRKIEDRADGLMSVQLEAVAEIPLTPRGKRVLVDQRLDLRRYGHVDG